MVDGTDQERALREDEPERIRLEAVIDSFDALLVLADVAETGGVVDDDNVDVTGDQSLNDKSELIESLNPVLAHKRGSKLEVGCSDLCSNDGI